MIYLHYKPRMKPRRLSMKPANALGLLGNFSIRLGGVNGRLTESMSVDRWRGSIPPNRREMLKRERLPQTRQ